MTFRDLVAISTGNLRRMKLRTFLTVSGVLIAIAAFVAMLSFGAGNQKYVAKEFNELGLFTTMQVFPERNSEQSADSSTAVLDRAALEKLASIPGVNLAYPYEAFSVSVKFGDSTISSKAQALPVSAIRTKLFSKLVAGEPFDSDSARKVMISGELVKSLGKTSGDSLIGQTIVISIRVSTIDSGLAHVFADNGFTVRDRIEKIKFDSLLVADYRRRTVREEVNGALRRFMNGFLNARQTISDSLLICGVMEEGHIGRMRIEPIIMPIKTAQLFSTGGFSENPADLFAAASSGTLFASSSDNSGRNYPQVTLDLDPRVSHKAVKDSVKALGFRSFSFAEQFDVIRRAFFYFDLALAVVGLIALTTASLGIVNTMVMSILERKREIGVLKSLGADENDIRLLFLVESGIIGAIGAVSGILFGWIITRIASLIGRLIMQKQGMPPVDLFALPPWLILIALSIGIGVSVIAGLYPANRAASVDPVEALRND